MHIDDPSQHYRHRLNRSVTLIRILFSAAAILIATSVQAAPKPTIAVVDEAGKPVAEFELMLHTADDGYHSFKPGNNGTIPHGLSNGSFRVAEFIDVVVRAKGFAPAIVSFDRKQREELLSGNATVVLERGQEVQLRFRLPEGLKLPDDFVPELYFDRYLKRVRMMRQPMNLKNGGFDFNVVDPVKTSENQFTIHLPKHPLPFYVGIHRPGLLQYFDVGPLTAADVKEGVLEIDVPRPAEIKLTFDAGATDADKVPYAGAAYDLLRHVPGTTSTHSCVVNGHREGVSFEQRFNDLSPGRYWVDILTTPKPDVMPLTGSEINPGRSYEVKILTLQAGESLEAEFHYAPFNPEAWRGPYTAMVRILAQDGSPAAGKKLKIGFFDGRFGSLPIFDGVVPEAGEVELQGLAEGVAPRPSASEPYSVTLDEQYVGTFGLSGDETTQRFEFRVPIRVGDAAPDVEFVEVPAGKAVRLSDLRGKIVFLEFWATWCGPCQSAMSKLNKLVAERREKWGDRVAVVALSIDDFIEAIEPHVKQRGWTDVQQYWANGTETGFKSPAAKSFVLHGVPSAFLIDPNGKIAWLGHPEDKDAEAQIEKLLTAESGSLPMRP